MISISIEGERDYDIIGDANSDVLHIYRIGFSRPYMSTKIIWISSFETCFYGPKTDIIHRFCFEVF